MQKHTLLINLSFSSNTASTIVISSNLQNANGYYSNSSQGLGGGIVTPSNVRGFLNDEVNSIIINDFYSYLTGSTNTVEFSEIYNSDAKLSSTFNNYYTSTILNHQYPSTSILNQSLTGTSGVTIIENSIFNYNGVSPQTSLENIPLSINNSTRQLNVFSALTTYTLEESYYIPVFIKRSTRQLDREKIIFDKVIDAISSVDTDEIINLLNDTQIK